MTTTTLSSQCLAQRSKKIVSASRIMLAEFLIADCVLAITIYNTGTAFLGTPIAVTSSGKGADLIMWLYYMTTTSDLWRVVYRKGVWGSPKDVASVGDDKMRKSTSLTVALHKEHNHIWFIKSDASGDVYTGYKDPLDADL